MQKIKELVEVFNGYYEQRDVKVAVAKKDFDTALKAAKLLPAGTKYEEEKKVELIKLLGDMSGAPAEVIAKTDNPTPTDINPEPIDDNGNPQEPTVVNPEPIDDNENTQAPKEPETETEPEAAPVADPVEQIIEASEVAETGPESAPAEEEVPEEDNEEVPETVGPGTEPFAAPAE